MPKIMTQKRKREQRRHMARLLNRGEPREQPLVCGGTKIVDRTHDLIHEWISDPCDDCDCQVE